MKTADFDYHLPADLIAKFPSQERSASRLLAVNATGMRDLHFADIAAFFQAGDCLVLNDTKVLQARLFGTKASGGKVELLIERILADNCALCHIRASRAPKIGSNLLLGNQAQATVLSREHNLFIIQFLDDLNIYDFLNQHGHMPLPPYIDRADTEFDATRYQTVFAQKDGAVAAPTAGLHFDEALLQQIAKRGVAIVRLTLHVGAGTFAPVKTEYIKDHQMHAEWVEIDANAAYIINQTKQQGGKIFACGTTVVRSLESAPRTLTNGVMQLSPWQGYTDIFITPGYQFHFIDRLITNFHLPQSTLLMLVSAFAGSQTIRDAYQHAIEARYRFFSYGDAMLLSPAGI